MNKDLMRRIVQEIEENPEAHDQTHWSAQNKCGTTFCVAGWACVLSGYEPSFLTDGLPEISPTVLKDGEIVYIQEKALELLDLHEEEATELFFSTEEASLNLLREWSK